MESGNWLLLWAGLTARDGRGVAKLWEETILVNIFYRILVMEPWLSWRERSRCLATHTGTPAGSRAPGWPTSGSRAGGMGPSNVDVTLPGA